MLAVVLVGPGHSAVNDGSARRPCRLACPRRSGSRDLVDLAAVDLRERVKRVCRAGRPRRGRPGIVQHFYAEATLVSIRGLGPRAFEQALRVDWRGTAEIREAVIPDIPRRGEPRAVRRCPNYLSNFLLQSFFDPPYQ